MLLFVDAFFFKQLYSLDLLPLSHIVTTWHWLKKKKSHKLDVDSAFLVVFSLTPTFKRHFIEGHSTDNGSRPLGTHRMRP